MAKKPPIPNAVKKVLGGTTPKRKRKEKYLSMEAVGDFLKEIPNGQTFSILYDKQDGTERFMTAKLGVRKYLKGGQNNMADHPEIKVVFDTKKKDYRSVNLRNVRMVKAKGKTLAADPDVINRDHTASRE